MEIPYTVQPRPDTGLPNTKVGIWLFLASEVMLFGALFSSYIFLRVGADFPWPFHDLVVWPGFLNTFVLIASSVTVVMAWASLKMRKFRAFQGYMAFTVLCALLFMVLKSYEYYGKFTHYGIKLNDGSVIEGHVGHDAQGANIIFGSPKKIAFNLMRGPNQSTVDFLHFFVEENKEKKHGDGTHKYEHVHDPKLVVKYKVGEKEEEVEVTKSWLKGKQKEFWEAYVAHNELVRGLAKDGKKPDESQKGPESMLTVEVVQSPPLLAFDERDRLSHSPTDVTFKDNTTISGQLVTDDIEFIPDNIDLRAMKRDSNDRKVLDKSMVWGIAGMEKFKPKWFANFEAETKPKEEGGRVIGDVRPATDDDVRRYSHRLELVKYNLFHISTGDKFEDAPAEAVMVKRADKNFFSNFTPRYNNFYAIYFTMTGLHGLHVVGGAIVLGYFLVTGRKMYEKNPQQLINRVEVGGLFWHFVDLVWTFLFPLYYLM